MFTRLTQKQLDIKTNFIKNYMQSKNAASGSVFDANANVSEKNLATLQAEINKDINIQINRHLMFNKIKELYGEELANEYVRQIEEHDIYINDESSLLPYCASISLYPFLLDGLTKLGGESKAPKHLESFCGNFVNLVFAVASQFAGAVATVEFLMYFDYFAKKDLGDNYLETHKTKIENLLQQVVYSINQPAAARGYQSVFWNISLYDKYYFESMFGDFCFPDFTKPEYESLNKLQIFFMSWFNKERTKAVLTFPVVTAAMLTKNNDVADENFKDFCADELSKGNSFFMYMSDTADSLSSCCRLRNVMDKTEFSYTLGAGGVSTGSIKVMTINMNRLIQKKNDLKLQVQKLHKYLFAYRKIVEEYIENKMLPVYDAGFIDINKQYLTIGINGLVEAAEYMGLEISNNKKYLDFIKENLKIIYDENRIASKENACKYNTEFIPGENVGVKHADWDKKDKLFVPRDCYNSYFYIVEDNNINSIDKFILHGKDTMEYLDGGSALHLNLEEKLTKEAYKKLLAVSAKTGCNYFCINVLITICNDCDYIDKETKHHCKKCFSKNVDHATRVIGYLKRISNFSSARQKEAEKRHYHLTNQ